MVPAVLLRAWRHATVGLPPIGFVDQHIAAATVVEQRVRRRSVARDQLLPRN